EKVKRIDKKIKKLIMDMIDTMIAAEGLGIAASQVGINQRVFIVRLNSGTKNELIVPMINAEIIKMSEKMIEDEEGCLSLPKKFGTVKRAASLTLKYQNQHGETHTLNLHELNARTIQHEIDHLDGILIVDRLEAELRLESAEKLPCPKQI
ncbi:MAG: peptide deformylase, partial [Patescibacteria group bacterium]